MDSLSAADRAVGACDTHDADNAGITQCAKTVNNVASRDDEDGAASKDSNDSADSTDDAGSRSNVDDESCTHVNNYADAK